MRALKDFDPERFRGRYRRGLGHARALPGHFIQSNVFWGEIGSLLSVTWYLEKKKPRSCAAGYRSDAAAHCELSALG